MRAKLSVLRACSRALKPGAKLAYYNIFIAPAATEEERRRALALGDPPEVAAPAEDAELLRRAGFVGVRQSDVTKEYLATSRAWYEARERYADELRKIDGDVAFEEGQRDRRKRIELIAEGLQRRALLVARRA